MCRPNLPPEEELKRAEKAVRGGARRLFELYIRSAEHHENRLDSKLQEFVAIQHHLQRYRNMSVLCGTGLAAASLLLCAFAIYSNAALAPLVWVLAPVTGLAGVFVWGYRPGAPEGRRLKRRPASLERSEELELPAQERP